MLRAATLSRGFPRRRPRWARVTSTWHAGVAQRGGETLAARPSFRKTNVEVARATKEQA
jgi:hypothetical protein